jgi:hypothetical protein
MTLRLRRCVSLLVCLSLLLSACSPDKSNKANEFNRITKVDKDSVEKIADHAPLPPENLGAITGNNKSLVDRWKGLSTTSKIVGTVAVVAVVGWVWWLGYNKGWWKKSSTQPPPPSLKELRDGAREMYDALIGVRTTWISIRSNGKDGELDVPLTKVLNDVDMMLNAVEGKPKKDKLMTLLETLVKSVRELTMQEIKDDRTKTRMANIPSVVEAFDKMVKRYCS